MNDSPPNQPPEHPLPDVLSEDAPPEDALTELGELGTVHILGIGGTGLSGLARILLARGVHVSGSDARESVTLAGLRELGATCFVGHDPAQLDGVDTVVVSTAIKQTNPELVAARERGLRVLSRAEAFAAMMAGYRVVAVSGAHGKTTTSSMLAMALRHCGADPSYAVGSVLSDTGTNAHHGSGELFVVEADESDRSFLSYSPEAAIVTNVDPDHLELHGSAEAYHRAFDEFVDRIVPGGFLVACLDDPGSRRLAEDSRARGYDVRTYGESDDADVRLVDLELLPFGTAFDLLVGGVRQGRIEVRVPGTHHALNATAAWVAATSLGFAGDAVREGLAGFSGTGRRFEPKGEVGGIRVYDSYAHHHTELIADLTAARNAVGDGRVVVCFRPLRHTRTQVFYKELGEALGLADVVVLTDPSGDDPIAGVTGELIRPHIPLPADQVCYEPSWPDAPARVAERARPGDLVLTLGAGDVAGVGPQVLKLLAEQAG